MVGALQRHPASARGLVGRGLGHQVEHAVCGVGEELFQIPTVGPHGQVCRVLDLLVSLAQGLISSQAQYVASVSDIPRHLCHQLIRAGVALFIPQPFHELDLQLLPVDLQIEIEEVGLYRALTVVETGAHPDIGYAIVNPLSEANTDGVDPIGRDHPSLIQGQIRRGETQPFPSLCPSDHLSLQAGIPPQQPGCLRHLPLGQQRPDAAAADDFALQSEGRDHAHGEAQLAAQLLQEGRAPLTLMAQSKIGAHPQLPQLQVAGESQNEIPGRGAGHLRGKS